jgi:hypothetical protein
MKMLVLTMMTLFQLSAEAQQSKLLKIECKMDEYPYTTVWIQTKKFPASNEPPYYLHFLAVQPALVDIYVGRVHNKHHGKISGTIGCTRADCGVHYRLHLDNGASMNISETSFPGENALHGFYGKDGKFWKFEHCQIE